MSCVSSFDKIQILQIISSYPELNELYNNTGYQKLYASVNPAYSRYTKAMENLGEMMALNFQKQHQEKILDTITNLVNTILSKVVKKSSEEKTSIKLRITDLDNPEKVQQMTSLILMKHFSFAVEITADQWSIQWSVANPYLHPKKTAD